MSSFKRISVSCRVALVTVALTSWLETAVAAEILINVVDPPNIGFNDPTPVAPTGGNPGTTLGEQRLFVFETVANIWEATLQPDVDIVVQSSFSPLPCTATSGVLGAAGTIQILANFNGALWPNTWYHSALANHLAGQDLTPGGPDPGLLQPPFSDEIVAFFNGDIGVDPNCLTGLTWYNGVDHNAPPNSFDLLNVVAHEFAHGLGFANFIDDPSGSVAAGLADIYTVYSKSGPLKMNQMDKKQRQAAAVDTGNLVWVGPNVTGQASALLAGIPVVRVNAPPAIAGDLEAQPAAYGLPLQDLPGVSGDIVLFNDGLGADPNDACEAVVDPNVAGNIALINRGSCNFSFKSAVAQLNGAVGVIIANNVPTGLPPMGGSDLIPPTISSVGISQADGDLIKNNLPGVNATLVADKSLGLSGADEDGFVKLYAPDPVAPGSSVSHFDTTVTPNALMEPFINTDLRASDTLDLTPFQMSDVGWDGTLVCPISSDDRSTVQVDSCETGIVNALGPFAYSVGEGLPSGGNANGMTTNGGCYIQDLVNACLAQPNSGQTASCISQVADHLQSINQISKSEAKTLQACF